MNKKTLIWIIPIWILLTLINYYFITWPYRYIIGVTLFPAFIAGIGFQLFGFIKNRKSLSKQQWRSVVVISVLVLLTFKLSWANSIIEQVDWYIFYSKRCEVVSIAKENKLKPDVSGSEYAFELPYTLPVLSTHGNYVSITKSEYVGRLTVTFDAYQSYTSKVRIIYTDDPGEIQRLDAFAGNSSGQNRKIRENWYRVVVM